MMKYITDLQGVYAHAVASGIRGADSDRLDLAYLHVPGATACTVLGTRNHFKSPSVKLSQYNASITVPKLLVVNSGNANAVTGKRGEEDVVSIIEMASSAFSVRKEEVLNASTGIIGVHLPMSRLRAGFSSLVRNTEATNGDLLQKAIMTTDLLEKFSSFSIPVDGHGSITAAGIAKGSGMIAPNMGTMFAFIVMNAPVTRHDLDKMTREVCDSTFNMMSVDTDTSTSDMMIVFANGNGEPSRALTEEEYQACYSALYSVSSSLCRQIARDGEGASRLIEVHVHEAASKEDARSIARAVSDSPLVKTAVHGADPNWGRIVMAIGKRPEVFVNPEKVSVQFGTHAVFRNGEPVTFDIDMLRQYLSEEKVEIHVYLGAGSEEAVSWGCDLTRGYIDINTCYN